jgi:hypothetical protein
MEKTCLWAGFALAIAIMIMFVPVFTKDSLINSAVRFLIGVAGALFGSRMGKMLDKQNCKGPVPEEKRCPEEKRLPSEQERYEQLRRILSRPAVVKADGLANRRVKTLDGAVTIYQDRDLNSPTISSPPIGTEVQLGSPSIVAGREWVEATLPNGDRGYALGPNVRGHSA